MIPAADDEVRKKLTEEWAREAQRIQKVLQDAAIKFDLAVSDVLGLGGLRRAWQGPHAT